MHKLVFVDSKGFIPCITDYTKEIFHCPDGHAFPITDCVKTYDVIGETYPSHLEVLTSKIPDVIINPSPIEKGVINKLLTDHATIQYYIYRRLGGNFFKSLDVKNYDNGVHLFLDDIYSHYYDIGKPLVTDRDYDILYSEMLNRCLVSGETGSHIQSVGDNILKKVELPYSMPSLNKKTVDDVDKWINSINLDQDQYFVISDKLDGVGVQLVVKQLGDIHLYRKGKDNYGQDISHLIASMNNIPLQHIKEGNFCVRGELIMEKTLFDTKYSKNVNSDGFSNSRSMVAGLTNRLKADSKLSDVKFVAHELIYPVMKPIDQFKFLHDKGFEVTNYYLLHFVNFINTASSYLKEILDRRTQESIYDTDGIVVTKNIINERPVYTEGKIKNPDYAIKFKEVAEHQQQYETEVIDIEWNLSRHNMYAPTVLIKEVIIDGVKYNRVTGHNAHFIWFGYLVNEKDKPFRPIGLGAIIKIVRSGDSIPKITEVVEPATCTAFSYMPKDDYYWDDNSINIYSRVSNGESNIRRISHFIKTIGVEGISRKEISNLYSYIENDDYVESIINLLKLSHVDLCSIKGFKDAKAKKVISIRSKLSNIAMHILMYSSGCFDNNLGKGKLRKICYHVGDSIYNNIDKSGLSVIEGIGDKTAESFIKYLPEFICFINRLESDGIFNIKNNIYVDYEIKHSSDKKVICFSGFRDPELEIILEDYGYSVIKNYTKKVDFLLIKDYNKDKDTGKIKKAKTNGIPVMTIREFADIYGLVLY
jgi:DNA ligase (NAD+)